jgi:hypothetical protein
VAETKERVAKIIPKEINYNISVLFFEKTSCLISVDAGNSANIQ